MVKILLIATKVVIFFVHTKEKRGKWLQSNVNLHHPTPLFDTKIGLFLIFPLKKCAVLIK